ncbi:DUF922 domain-containing protein [Maribacter sp. 2210JD10-5]|uniref:DUF922 domain-containing protein n=1 Tax=Maribacter sp. 2210JD10-5 TaxID=3386272 RepID=UPI0039BD5D94
MFCQEEMAWNEDRRLRWEDFKGNVPLGSSAAATTASGISYQFSTYYENDELKLDYEVNSFFYPTKSWYKPQISNEIILAHEQLHFDITEVFTRKMRKELAQKQFTKNVKKEVRTIYKRILKELNDYQNDYDKETDFSRNIEKQDAWVKKIKKILAQK